MNDENTDIIYSIPINRNSQKYLDSENPRQIPVQLTEEDDEVDRTMVTTVHY